MKIYDNLAFGFEPFLEWIKLGTKQDLLYTLKVFIEENKKKECQVILDLLIL